MKRPAPMSARDICSLFLCPENRDSWVVQRDLCKHVCSRAGSSGNAGCRMATGDVLSASRKFEQEQCTEHAPPRMPHGAAKGGLGLDVPFRLFSLLCPWLRRNAPQGTLFPPPSEPDVSMAEPDQAETIGCPEGTHDTTESPSRRDSLGHLRLEP